jgi:hypothetical protein
MKSDHEVIDWKKECWKEKIKRQLCHCFRKEVNVRPVHAVEMLTKKYRQFQAENLWILEMYAHL